MEHDEIDALIRSGKKRPLYLPEAAHRTELGVAAIEALIPHRHPFLLVDRIDAVDLPNGNIAGRRWVDPKDPLFVGHFPGDPIYPGVLQLEAIGQLGLCLFGMVRGANKGGVRALKVHHAVFPAAVRPGAELRLIAKTLESNDYTGICAGQVLDGDTICCVAVMEVYFVEG